MYNPVAHSRPILLRLPVNSSQLSVIDDSGQSIMSQVDVAKMLFFFFCMLLIFGIGVAVNCHWSYFALTF